MSDFLSASAILLQRPIPDDYLAQQTSQFAAPLPRSVQESAFSAIIFRLADEWFALPSCVCQQVLLPVSAHTLPQRSNETLLGVANVRGQMLLKVSLFDLLGLAAPTHLAHTRQADKPQRLYRTHQVYPRMIVIGKKTSTGESDRWVFDVDELDGIHTVSHDQMESLAAGAKDTTACTQNLFVWQKKRVSLLDENRLFELLRQRAL